MDELEEIKRRKLQQMQQAQQQKAAQDAQVSDAMKQIDVIIQRLLTPDAVSRLQNLGLVNPELVQKLKIYLAQLSMNGRATKIDDAQLKDILTKIQGSQREITIKRV
jgi:programmed cell death protein 5